MAAASAVAAVAVLLVAGCGSSGDGSSGDGSGGTDGTGSGNGSRGNGAGGSCAGGHEVVVSVDDATGDMELQHARPDGEVTEITIDWPDDDAADDASTDPASRPDFSPDGERLAVVRADGDYESAGPSATWLWTVAADGSDPRPLTDGAVHDDQPDWSPDGTTVAFSRSVVDGPPLVHELMVVDAAGGEPRPLVTGAAPDPGAATADHSPRWAPDGSRLAFVRHRRPPGETTRPTTSVMLVDADGTNVRELAPAPEAANLDWSPDGRWLLVSLPTTGEDSTVQLVDAATGEPGPRIEDAAEAVWADDELLWYVQLDGDSGDLVSRFPLRQARLDGDRVEPVGDPVDVGAGFLYGTLGLAARPCP